MEIYELTVHELIDKLDKKELTSKQILESYLKRIDEKEPEVQAFVTKNNDTEEKYDKFVSYLSFK